MILLAICIGIGLPISMAWLLLGLMQGRVPVLTHAEHLAWSAVCGPTLSMAIVFYCYAIGIVRFTLIGFLVPMLIAVAVLGVLAWRCGVLISAAQIHHKGTSSWPQWQRIGIGILLAWTALKLGAGTFDLVSVPTYWDDSFNSWNMRGKMFAETGEFTLSVPGGNETTQNKLGVSSYPPAIPMYKAWLTLLAGKWSEPLVNGVHIVWFLGLLCAFYCAIKREFSTKAATIGSYILVSLPLMLVQATNPYADTLLAAHIFLASYSLYRLLERQEDERASWLLLFGLSLGLMTMTKNEGTVLYAPILLGVLGLALLLEYRRSGLDRRCITRMLMASGTMIGLALPWIAFKFIHGLSFGNAQAVSTLRLAFSPNALWTLWYNYSHEANWLILPVACVFIVAFAGKRSWNTATVMLALFIGFAAMMQVFIFTYTSISVTAIDQTGIGRGMLHIVPVVILLLVLLSSRALHARPEDER